MNAKLLLSYKQEKRSRYPVPYIYSLSKKGQGLFYFGANHSHDPKNKQYKMLDKFWTKYIKETKNYKRVVLLEGGLSKASKNKKNEIKLYAENGYASLLANSNNILLISPEPSLQFEAEQLLKKYSKDEIEYYYFARVVHQWHSLLKPRPSMVKYINHFLQMDKKALKWPKYEFSLKNMQIIHKKIFKNDMNLNDAVFFNDLMNPYKLSKVNRVASASGRVRDLYILGEIEKCWKKGLSLFIVFGASHAFMQRKSLENMIH